MLNLGLDLVIIAMFYIRVTFHRVYVVHCTVAATQMSCNLLTVVSIGQLRTTDSKRGTRMYILGNFRTLLLVCHVYKTLCFSFETFRAVQLIKQIVANLNCGYFKGSAFFYTSCMLYTNFYVLHYLCSILRSNCHVIHCYFVCCVLIVIFYIVIMFYIVSMFYIVF